jgi:hypothetical protein
MKCICGITALGKVDNPSCPECFGGADAVGVGGAAEAARGANVTTIVVDEGVTIKPGMIIPAERTSEKFTGGIAEYIRTNYEKVPPLTEEKFDQFMEVAFQPPGFCRFMKDHGWELQSETMKFVKGARWITFRHAVDSYRCNELSLIC